MSGTSYQFIRVTVLLENFIGKKIHYSFCIPIEDQKELYKGMSDLIEFCTKHVPMLHSVELVNVK